MAYRYDYAWRKTREKAEALIEQMFAEGIVSEAEKPIVEKRGRYKNLWFFVTLLDTTGDDK